MDGKTIKDVFDAQCAHVEFNRRRYELACALQEGFVNRQQEHIAFFGGNTTGLHRVRFIDSDRDKLFDLLLEADEHQLKDELYALRDAHGNPVIRQDFIVSRDVFNISSIWLIHKFHSAAKLSKEQREDAKVRVATYLLYKFLTSLLSHYYPYPPDPGIAAATYNALTLKFSLKQHGNWGSTLVALATSLVDDHSVNARNGTIEAMDDDGDVIRMINDMQGRVRDMLKNITAVFHEVLARGNKVGSAVALQDVEGELELRDRTDNLGKYSQYIRKIMSDSNSFVRDELVDVIATTMRTLSRRTLFQALAWTSQQYHGQYTKEIDKCIDLVMDHAFDYLTTNRDIAHHDIASVIDRLRGAYMSSRSTDPRLLAARAEVQKLMAVATGSSNENMLAAARTAWMLYLVARAFTMRHYSNK